MQRHNDACPFLCTAIHKYDPSAFCTQVEAGSWSVVAHLQHIAGPVLSVAHIRLCPTLNHAPDPPLCDGGTAAVADPMPVNEAAATPAVSCSADACAAGQTEGEVPISPLYIVNMGC